MKAYCEPSRIEDSALKVNIFSYMAKEHTVHPHWHDNVEILYIISGSIGVQLTDSFYVLSEGEMTVIGKDEIHSTYSITENNTEILVFHISHEFMDTTQWPDEDKSILEDFMENCIQFPQVLTKNTPGMVNVLEYIYKVKEEYTEKKHACGILVKAYVLAIIGILVRISYGKTKKVPDKKNIDRIKSMLTSTFELIDDKYMENITLEMAASASHLSVSHFCRIFKRATSKTFNDYLTSYRVKLAEKLLRSELTVAAIAHQCGFESISSFNRAFKKIKNLTPSELRSIINS